MTDGPQLQLERGGKIIRRQAPVVVYFCETPHGVRKAAECGHQAATCYGKPQTCPRCRFPYCEHNFTVHIHGPFYYPRDAWKTVQKAFVRELDRVASVAGKSPVRVRVPRVKRAP